MPELDDPTDAPGVAPARPEWGPGTDRRGTARDRCGGPEDGG